MNEERKKKKKKEKTINHAVKWDFLRDRTLGNKAKEKCMVVCTVYCVVKLYPLVTITNYLYVCFSSFCC